MIEIRADVLHDFERASRLEWLETDGLGGWASSTVSGAHSRRYHGLLVVALDPPVRRTMAVSKLDETLHLGETSYELGSNRYPGVVQPQGFRLMTAFRRDLFPVFEWQVAGIELRKTVAAIHGESTVVVVYEVLDAPRRFVLELRPFMTWRDIHALGPSLPLPQRVAVEAGTMRWYPEDDGPEIFIRVPGAAFEHHTDWYHRFEYDAERERGLDFEEDLWTPGLFMVEVGAGDRVAVILSTVDPDQRDGLELISAEAARRQALVANVGGGEDAVSHLMLAADQLVVRRGADLSTVIAGYHWFADWGRDTMIALPGLCLATGRFDDARRILLAFAGTVDRGMLPNRFPDHGEAPEYNTVDATLWFFVAIRRYIQATGDLEIAREVLLPVLRDIVAWHDRGTRYGIRVDDDGLLASGVPGVQLTWMDARIGDQPVTPRHCKPVEIQALWANALAILAELERRVGEPTRAEVLERRFRQVVRAFGRAFWNPAAGCLFDVVGGGWVDPSIRPNQVIAISLPYPMVGYGRARAVLGVVDRELLTPVGLRSLEPGHPDYCSRYEGPPWRRDGAYHQGTVWPWLLGPWATAMERAYGDDGRRRARAHLERFLAHLGEAGVGTVSEIFDGDPPHTPRGAIAQAWSVGELLRVLLGETPADEGLA